MMLKTSSNKHNATLGMFFYTIRQNIGLVVLTVIGMLLVCPGYITIQLNDYYDRLSKTYYEFNTALEMFGIAACIAGAIGVVVYNIINFLFLYSKKSSDVFHSVPLTRTQLLLSRSLAGLACTFIPLIIGYVSILCVVLFTPWVVADLEILAVLAFYNIFIMLAAWSISLLFLICAGSIFDFALSCGIVNISLLILPTILSYIAEETLFGYTYSTMEWLMKRLSPIYFYAFSLMDFLDRSGTYNMYTLTNKQPLFNSNEVAVLIVSVILISALTAACILLYKRRNAEKAGNAYAFKFVYVVSNLLLSFEVGFGVGSIFSDFNIASPAFWIFAVAGTLLAAAAFGAISERGFKTVKKSLIIGGIAAAALIITVSCYAIDIIGYENRIPQKNDISIVHANIEGFTVALSTDDIDDVTNLHKKIISDYETEFDKMTHSNEEYFTTSYVNFVYQLKSGITIERTYYGVPTEPFADQLLAVCRHEEVTPTITLINSDKPKNIRFGGVNRAKDEYFEYAITREEFVNLLTIYNRDNDKMTKDIFTNHYSFHANWDSEFVSETSRHGGFFDFCVGDNYTEFLAAVNALEDKYQNLAAEGYYEKFED